MLALLADQIGLTDALQDGLAHTQGLRQAE